MLISHVVSETLLESVSFVANVAFIRLQLAVEDFDVASHVPNLNVEICKKEM